MLPKKKRVFLYRNTFRWPGTCHGPFNSAPMGVNSISCCPPHVRPMGLHRTCGEPGETKKDTCTHPEYVTSLARAQVRRMLRSCGSSRSTGPHPRPFNSNPMGVKPMSSAWSLNVGRMGFNWISPARRGRTTLNGWGPIRFRPPTRTVATRLMLDGWGANSNLLARPRVHPTGRTFR